MILAPGMFISFLRRERTQSLTKRGITLKNCVCNLSHGRHGTKNENHNSESIKRGKARRSPERSALHLYRIICSRHHREEKEVKEHSILSCTRMRFKWLNMWKFPLNIFIMLPDKKNPDDNVHARRNSNRRKASEWRQILYHLWYRGTMYNECVSHSLLPQWKNVKLLKNDGNICCSNCEITGSTWLPAKWRSSAFLSFASHP